MKTSPEGRKFIEGWEGLRLRAYDDTTEKVVPVGGRVVGTLTIGYGHTTSAGPPRVYAGMEISAEDADMILAADLGHVEADIARVVKVPLSQSQFDSLVSFHYNTGWLTHKHCSLLVMVNAGEFEAACSSFKLYDKAYGEPLFGLIRRREAEARLFGEGVYD